MVNIDVRWWWLLFLIIGAYFFMRWKGTRTALGTYRKSAVIAGTVILFACIILVKMMFDAIYFEALIVDPFADFWKGDFSVYNLAITIIVFNMIIAVFIWVQMFSNEIVSRMNKKSHGIKFLDGRN